MASKEQPFSDNYLLLKPEEATLVDLILFLFSSGSGKRKFIDCPEDNDEHYRRNFRRRWLIFISTLVQKALLFLAKPLAKLGNIIENVLNFISTNGGLFLLPFKILLRRNLVRPNKSSASYRSIVGLLDTRKELDKNIKPDNLFKYYGSLSVMASKLSYENRAFVQAVVDDHWKMKFLGFYNFWNDFQGQDTTQAMIFQATAANPDLIVVAFRGTSPFDAYDWQVDLDLSWFEIKGIGKIHSGFMKALGLQKGKGWPKEITQSGEKQKYYAYYTIRKILKEVIQKNNNAKFIITGHSLGGALAILFVTVLLLHEEELLLKKLEAVYTFGQPRVGDEELGKFMKRNLEKFNIKYHRYVYSNDLVPRVPYDDKTLMFKHFGSCLFFDCFYKGKVLVEEPNKNYFSLFWVIPKIFNAEWELMRSFIIPFFKGFDYYESWFMKLFRLIGIVIPGLTAHLPQDYVNSTRLGFIQILEDDPDPKVD